MANCELSSVTLKCFVRFQFSLLTLTLDLCFNMTLYSFSAFKTHTRMMNYSCQSLVHTHIIIV